jgi:cation diffusion facilitator CzcD-associated flavoprotein CzcO
MSIQRAIKSVAVIGGGPAGIACVNELAHVTAAGDSLLEKHLKPKNPAFEKIICFEQNSKLGGVWNFFKKPDLSLPPLTVLNHGNYNKPDEIYEAPIFPDSKLLKNTSIDNPVVKISDKKLTDEIRWHRNASYKDLFTNIPEKFMRFSYTPYKKISNGRFLEPLVSLNDVRDYLANIVERYDLKKHFRVNSGVELIEKIKRENGEEKWLLTIRQKSPFSKVEQWYTEEFDAVIAANGHCNVPFIPKTEGLNEFVEKNPGILKHSKSFRDLNEYKNSNILLCGSGTSSFDLLQYLSPVAKSVTISQKSKSVYSWIDECFSACKDIKFKPRISKYLPDSGEVQFDDGSIRKYDHIVLSTGYHYHYPFIKPDDEFVKIYDRFDLNNQISKIGNLYLYTFSTVDNTFATAGIPTIGLMFHGMEYSAAAIAGVFSGAKKLPSNEQQIAWDDGRTKISEPEVPHRYQGFFLEKIEDQFLNPLFELAPNGRSNPLKKDGWTLEEVDQSIPALKKAFFALKSGECSSRDLLK